MAVVKDYYIGNTHVIVKDDAYAHLTPEELKERQERVAQNIFRIIERDRMEKIEREIAKEEEEKKKDGKREETYI